MEFISSNDDSLTCFEFSMTQYMERAETLSKLRGDSISSELKEEWMKTKVDWSSNDFTWKRQAAERFPASFLESSPENAQRMILWCLERQPSRRPSAEELLSVWLNSVGWCLFFERFLEANLRSLFSFLCR